MRYQEKELDLHEAFEAWLIHKQATAGLDEILNWHYYKKKWFFEFLLSLDVS